MPPSKIWNLFKRNESKKSTTRLLYKDLFFNMDSTSTLWIHYNAWYANDNTIEIVQSTKVK